MFCPQCGSEVSNDWRLCPRCAAPLSKTHHSSQEPLSINGNVSKGPGLWLFGVGALIIIIPLILAIVLLVVDLFDSDPKTRFVVPGTHELDFDDSGKYTIYYEYQSSINGRGYSSSEYLKSIEVDLQSEDGSIIVPLSTSEGNATYQIGGRAGRSLFSFDIEEPGTYIIHADYQDGTSTPEVVFAIGPEFDILGIMLRSFGLGIGSFVVGGIFILWVFIKRRRVAEQTGLPAPDPYVSPRSRLAVTLLAVFVGQLGIHRFYLEKYLTGV